MQKQNGKASAFPKIKIIISAFIILVGLALSVLLCYKGIMAQERLLVGFSRVNVSPVIDGELLAAPLGGYAGERRAESIESDIYAICTAFEDKDGNRALIFSIDSLGLDAVTVDTAISKISEKAGVKKENIILNCTHNHSAPEVSSTIKEAITYRSFLIDRLIDAAKAAVTDLSLCTALYTGYLNIPDFTYIRREDNTSVDPKVAAARFSRIGKRDILLINFAAHCDTVTSFSRTAVSSDYVGVVRDTLEQTLGANASVQMGACGDVNPSSFPSSGGKYIGKDWYGRALADNITLQLMKLSKTEIVSKVDSIKRTVGAAIDHSTDHLYQKAIEIRNLYYANKLDEYQQKCNEYEIDTVYEAASIIKRAEAEDYRDVTVSAIRVGGIAFAAVPYEMFSQNGAKIKEESDFDLTFVMGYSNGRNTYIPASYAYDVGGYEVYSCHFERGTAELLEETLSRMIAELYDNTLCRHSFKSVWSDENYHLIECELCKLSFANPTRHTYSEDDFCTICKTGIHKIGALTGFSGLTMAAIGSSTTQGAKIERSYVDIVEDLLGLRKTYNYGVSWSTIGHRENCTCNHPYLPDDYIHDPMVYRCTEIESADIIFIYGGLNDFGVKLPLGTPADKTQYTFYGALDMLLSRVKTAYPDSYVFMATGFNYFDGYTNGNGDTWESFNDAIRLVCERYGVDCLDLYTEPFNRITDTVDYVHPTQEYTTNVLAPKIAEFIKKNYPRTYYYHGCERCTEGEKIYYENLFTDTPENHGKICTYDLSTKMFIEKERPGLSYTLINVEDINEVRFAFSKDSPSVAFSYFFYDKNDKYVGGANLEVGLTNVYVTVPRAAVYLAVLYNPKAAYGVYQAG